MKKKPVDNFMMLIGIDEAGRGPLAGPVAVGVFLIKTPNAAVTKKLWNIFHGVKESKQLSEEQRERWFSIIEKTRAGGLIDFSVQFQSPLKIDTHGLARTINDALKKGLEKVLEKAYGAHDARDSRDNFQILLDGGLHAPAHFKNQKTIIRGDEKEIIIALASICAKVLRDRRMVSLAKKYPQYGFEIHKGYGTRAHIAAIRKHGPSPIHRKLFLRNI